MSHYAVALFADSPYDFDRLMAPYNESDEKYFVFEPVSDEEILSGWEKFKQQNPALSYSDWLQSAYTLKDHQYGHWHNPNGYYDYYSLDGKSYLFDLLPEARARYDADEHPLFYNKSDMDWFAPSTEHGESYWRGRWREYSKNGDGFYNEKHYLTRFETEDQYVKEMMRPVTPYAFVTPDGVWHAPGTVGWFALSDETKDSMDAYYDEWCRFIREAPDCFVSILDCHI